MELDDDLADNGNEDDSTFNNQVKMHPPFAHFQLPYRVVNGLKRKPVNSPKIFSSH